MLRLRLGLVALTTVLALVGALFHWHLTINTTNIRQADTSNSPLHKPMTAEKCYELAQIRPSLDQMQGAFGVSGSPYVYVLDIGEGRDCIVSYFDGNNHPSAVSLDLR